MKMFINPINGKPTPDSMIIELLLKSRLNLNSKIEIQDGFYLINNAELVIVLDQASEAIFRSIAKLQPSKVIALDISFKDNDQLIKPMLHCK